MAGKPWIRALLDRFDRRAHKASFRLIDAVISEVGDLTYEEMKAQEAADFTFIDYETAIAGAAAAAGERVLLAARPELADLDLEPGRVIPPDLLEELQRQDPYLERAWNDLTRIFEERLIPAADVPDADEMIRRASDAAAGGPWPRWTVPGDHLPQRDVLEIAAALRFDASFVAEKFDLDADRQVEAWMLATAGLVGGPYSALLDPKIGTRLATETLLAVAMTAPMR